MMRNEVDRLQVQHVINNTYELQIRCSDGSTDTFLYDRSASPAAKDLVSENKESRQEAIIIFEVYLNSAFLQ